MSMICCGFSRPQCIRARCAGTAADPLAHERGLLGQPDLLGTLREEILAVVASMCSSTRTRSWSSWTGQERLDARGRHRSAQQFRQVEGPRQEAHGRLGALRVPDAAFTGLQTNMLRPSIQAAGLDLDDLPQRGAIDIGKDIDIGARDNRPKRWKDIWSAGDATSGVTEVLSVDELVARTLAEYREAAAHVRLG